MEREKHNSFKCLEGTLVNRSRPCAFVNTGDRMLKDGHELSALARRGKVSERVNQSKSIMTSAAPPLLFMFGKENKEQACLQSTGGIE